MAYRTFTLKGLSPKEYKAILLPHLGQPCRTTRSLNSPRQGILTHVETYLEFTTRKGLPQGLSTQNARPVITLDDTAYWGDRFPVEVWTPDE